MTLAYQPAASLPLASTKLVDRVVAPRFLLGGTRWGMV